MATSNKNKGEAGLLGLALACLLLPGLAVADVTLNPSGGLNSWDIFVMGGGEAFGTILQGTGALVALPGYHSLMVFIAVIGSIVMAASAGFDIAKAPKMIGYFLLVWSVSFFGLNAKSAATVNDPISGYYQAYPQLPSIVVIPVSVVTTVGHWITGAVEQSFGTFAHYPDEMHMSRGGRYGMAASLLSDLHKFTILDPYLRFSLSNYMGSCVHFGVAAGQISEREMMTTADFWTAVKSDNQAVYTEIRIPAAPGEKAEPVTETKGQPDLMTCPAAWAKLDAYLTMYVPQLAEASGAGWSQTGVFTKLASDLSTSAAWVAKDAAGASGLDGGSMIKQSAMLNMWTDANRNAANQTGNGEMQTALASATALQSQESSWQIAATLAEHTLGYLNMLLLALMVAVSPMVVALALIPGVGKKSFSNLIKVFLWLACWEPVLAIVGYISAAYLQADLGPVIGTYGVNIVNTGVVTKHANTVQLVSGFLASMAPMIVWSLVEGGQAFTHLVSQGLGTHFATSAGQQAATGNVSLNSQNLDNASFSQRNFASTWQDGHHARQMFTNSGQVDNVHEAGGSSEKLNGSLVERTIGDSKTASKNLELAKSQYQSNEKSIGHDVDRVVADAKAATTDRNGGRTTASGDQILNEIAKRYGVQVAKDVRNNLSERHIGIEESAAAGKASNIQAGTTAEAHVGGDVPGFGGAKVGINTSASQAKTGNDTHTSRAGGGQGTQNGEAVVKTGDTTHGGTHSGSAGTTTTGGATAALTDTGRRELSDHLKQGLSARSGLEHKVSEAEAVKNATDMGFKVHMAVSPERDGAHISAMLAKGEAMGYPSGGPDAAGIEAKVAAERERMRAAGAPTELVPVHDPRALQFKKDEDWAAAPEQNAEAAVAAQERKAAGQVGGFTKGAHAAPAVAAPTAPADLPTEQSVNANATRIKDASITAEKQLEQHRNQLLTGNSAVEVKMPTFTGQPAPAQQPPVRHADRSIRFTATNP